MAFSSLMSGARQNRISPGAFRKLFMEGPGFGGGDQDNGFGGSAPGPEGSPGDLGAETAAGWGGVSNVGTGIAGLAGDFMGVVSKYGPSVATALGSIVADLAEQAGIPVDRPGDAGFGGGDQGNDVGGMSDADLATIFKAYPDADAFIQDIWRTYGGQRESGQRVEEMLQTPGIQRIIKGFSAQFGDETPAAAVPDKKIVDHVGDDGKMAPEPAAADDTSGKPDINAIVSEVIRQYGNGSATVAEHGGQHKTDANNFLSNFVNNEAFRQNIVDTWGDGDQFWSNLQSHLGKMGAQPLDPNSLGKGVLASTDDGGSSDTIKSLFNDDGNTDNPTQNDIYDQIIKIGADLSSGGATARSWSDILGLPKHPTSAAAALGAAGDDGDTMVAHINDWEAALLKLLGGSGTVNPKTGLIEFSNPMNVTLHNGTTMGFNNQADADAWWAANPNGGRDTAEVLAENPGRDIMDIKGDLAASWNAPGAQGWLDAIRDGHNNPGSDPSNPQPFSPDQVSGAGFGLGDYVNAWQSNHGKSITGGPLATGGASDYTGGRTDIPAPVIPEPFDTTAGVDPSAQNNPFSILRNTSIYNDLLPFMSGVSELSPVIDRRTGRTVYVPAAGVRGFSDSFRDRRRGGFSNILRV